MSEQKKEEICRYLEKCSINVDGEETKRCKMNIDGVFYTISGERGGCKTDFWRCSYRLLLGKIEELYGLLKTQSNYLYEIALLRKKLESKSE